MPLYDQVELLCQAIATQAKGEVEEIMARAREEADRRLNEAEARRQEVLARTKAEVEAQARLDARSRIDRPRPRPGSWPFGKPPITGTGCDGRSWARSSNWKGMSSGSWPTPKK